MKSNLLLLFLFIVSFTHAQPNLTPKQWQEDLSFLQKTIHEEYPFLFKKISAEHFDELVNKLDNQIDNLSEHEIIVGLARIVAAFGYGHTSIGISGKFDRDEFQFHYMPYHIKQFADGFFIQGITKEYADHVGAKVLAIEGSPIEDVIKSVKKAFPLENDQFFKAYGLSFLGTPEILHAQGVTDNLQTELELKLEKDGKTYNHVFASLTDKDYSEQYGYVFSNDKWVSARNTVELPLYLTQLEKIYHDIYLEDQNTLYVRQSQIMNDAKEDIETFYNRIFSFIDSAKVDKLILDVRLNGGGDNTNNKSIVTGAIKSRINQLGSFIVIIGDRTFSACQNLVNELDNYTEVIFVGEPTGENINFYGDNNHVQLPNSNITVRLSWAWWQDKPQWRNKEWTTPHIATDMTFDQFVSNEDPALDAALNFSGKGFIKDPMSYLSNLFQTGQIMKLQTESQRIATDPAYKFFDFEGEFTGLAYNLMGRGDSGTASMIFQMLSNFFPDSPGVWFGMAESQLKNGNSEKARELFNKVSAMPNSGDYKEKAVALMKSINN